MFEDVHFSMDAFRTGDPSTYCNGLSCLPLKEQVVTTPEKLT